MGITITRTGGYAGIEKQLGAADHTRLDPAKASAVSSELAALAKLAQTTPSPGADQLKYQIEVKETGKPTKTLVVVDNGDPNLPEMKSLAKLAGALGLSLA